MRRGSFAAAKGGDCFTVPQLGEPPVEAREHFLLRVADEVLAKDRERDRARQRRGAASQGVPHETPEVPSPRAAHAKAPHGPRERSERALAKRRGAGWRRVEVQRAAAEVGVLVVELRE
jgi:hypothetical protein